MCRRYIIKIERTTSLKNATFILKLLLVISNRKDYKRNFLITHLQNFVYFCNLNKLNF